MMLLFSTVCTFLQFRSVQGWAFIIIVKFLLPRVRVPSCIVVSCCGLSAVFLGWQVCVCCGLTRVSHFLFEWSSLTRGISRHNKQNVLTLVCKTALWLVVYLSPQVRQTKQQVRGWASVKLGCVCAQDIHLSLWEMVPQCDSKALSRSRCLRLSVVEHRMLLFWKHAGHVN